MSDYATPEDLERLGVANEALAAISDEKQESAIEARSRFADGYLSVRVTIPDGGLTAFTGDLTWAVCQLSCYDLVSNLGYTVNKDNADNLRKRHDDAIKWLEAVRDGKIGPPIPATSLAAESALGPVIASNEIRGWTPRGL